MAKREQWETIRPLGEGGQGKVFLVRSPDRVVQRKIAKQDMVLGLYPLSRDSPDNVTVAQAERVANAMFTLARPDDVDDLGALKEFQIRTDETQVLKRLESEIRALREIRHAALLKMLDASLEERFLVTEYHPNGSLATKPHLLKGDLSGALKAFKRLAEGVSLIHKAGAIHRDIKAANIFVTESNELVLGDFGIVFFPGGERLTKSSERVGTRYWVPPWADRKVRLEEVDPTLDVYALGKVLWLMLAGIDDIFNRENYLDDEYNLEKMFVDQANMKLVNDLLAKCVVSQKSQCLASVELILQEVDDMIARISPTHLYRKQGQTEWPCRLCGIGRYVRLTAPMRAPASVYGSAILRVLGKTANRAEHEFDTFICSHCRRVELFYPQA
jgi:serine/threonine protein kinase